VEAALARAVRERGADQRKATAAAGGPAPAPLLPAPPRRPAAGPSTTQSTAKTATAPPASAAPAADGAALAASAFTPAPRNAEPVGFDPASVAAGGAAGAGLAGSAASASTAAVLSLLAAAATVGRITAGLTVAEAMAQLSEDIARHHQAFDDAGAAQAAELTTAFVAARARVTGHVATTAGAISSGAAEQQAQLEAWRATAPAAAQQLLAGKRAGAIAMGDEYAGRAITAAESAADNALHEVSAAAVEAREIGNAHATVGGSNPEAAKAKADAAHEIANDTAGNITEGLDDFTSGLRESGPQAGDKFREQAATAAEQIEDVEPQIVDAFDAAHADAATAVADVVFDHLAELNDARAALLDRLDAEHKRAREELAATVAARHTDLDLAAATAAAALSGEARRALDTADRGASQLSSAITASGVSDAQAGTASAAVTGAVLEAYGAIGGAATDAIIQTREAFGAVAQDTTAALGTVSSAAAGDLDTVAGAVEGQLDAQRDRVVTAVRTATTSAAGAGKDLLGEAGGAIDAKLDEVAGGFDTSLQEYTGGLDDKVAEKHSDAREPMADLGDRITSAQTRIEDEQGQSWLGRQFSQLFSMLSDPGFWAGLVVGLVLAVIVIALLPEELVGLAVIALAIGAFALVGAIAAGVGTIVSNLYHGRPWHEGLLKNMLIGAVFGAALAGVAIWLGAAAATLAGIATISSVAGVLTVITNVVTGRPWDENLLANMLLAGLFAWAGKVFARPGTKPGPTIRDPNNPPVVDPNAPPVVDPNAPPVVDPNAPPVVDPNAPPAVDPNAPPAVDPNAPRAYDPLVRTEPELVGDTNPDPRPGETPDQALDRAIRAEAEMEARRSAALPERPPSIDMATQEGPGHTLERHGPDIPLERELDANGNPTGTRTIEGRIYGDPDWPMRANKSSRWSSMLRLNQVVNRYLRANWEAIRGDLIRRAEHENTFDAGGPVGDSYINTRFGQPGGAANPEPALIPNVGRVTIVIRYDPGATPPFHIHTVYPDPPVGF
jgi:hypothetical protein